MEVGARAAAFGGDKAGRCAAPAKALKARKDGLAWKPADSIAPVGRAVLGISTLSHLK